MINDIALFVGMVFILFSSLTVFFYVLVNWLIKPMLTNAKLLWHYLYYVNNKEIINEWIDKNIPEIQDIIKEDERMKNNTQPK